MLRVASSLILLVTESRRITVLKKKKSTSMFACHGGDQVSHATDYRATHFVLLPSRNFDEETLIRQMHKHKHKYAMIQSSRLTSRFRLVKKRLPTTAQAIRTSNVEVMVPGCGSCSSFCDQASGQDDLSPKPPHFGSNKHHQVTKGEREK